MEPALGITVACAPLMRPIFDKIPLFSRSNRVPQGGNRGTSSFERLEEPSHSLTEFERPNASVVTSCRRGDAQDLKDEEQDAQPSGGVGGQTSKGFQGITVRREFYTQRA